LLILKRARIQRVTQTGNALQSAIELLYTTFKRYPLRPEIVGCPCCVNENDQARLHQSPLSELSSPQLGHYAFKAITTWGDADDFRHFLPRIFELIATDDQFPVEPEIVLGKLAYGEWSHWPAKQRSAIETFLQAWWSDLLSEYPARVSTLNADDALCSLGNALEDLQSYLDGWREDADLAPRRHLAWFVRHNYLSMAKKMQGRLRNAFWRGRDQQREQVERWLREADLHGLLATAVQGVSDSSVQDEFLLAIDYLDWLRL
jgi:hypothetical protein